MFVKLELWKENLSDIVGQEHLPIPFGEGKAVWVEMKTQLPVFRTINISFIQEFELVEVRSQNRPASAGKHSDFLGNKARLQFADGNTAVVLYDSFEQILNGVAAAALKGRGLFDAGLSPYVEIKNSQVITKSRS